MRVLLFLLLATANKLTAQTDTSNHTTPFDAGIRLENSGVLIPWGVKPTDLTEIGNPKIHRLTRGDLNVVWDSVIICGGVKGFIKFTSRKKKHDDYTRLFYLYAGIDNDDFEKVVQYCKVNIYTVPKYNLSRGKYPQYIWRTSRILVQIIKGKYSTLIYIALRDPDML